MKRIMDIALQIQNKKSGTSAHRPKHHYLEAAFFFASFRIDLQEMIKNTVPKNGELWYINCIKTA